MKKIKDVAGQSGKPGGPVGIEEIRLSLDKTLCFIDSMGKVITRLCEPESEPVGREILADLGRVISHEAMSAFDRVCELKEPKWKSKSETRKHSGPTI